MKLPLRQTLLQKAVHSQHPPFPLFLRSMPKPEAGLVLKQINLSAVAPILWISANHEHARHDFSQTWPRPASELQDNAKARMCVQ